MRATERGEAECIYQMFAGADDASRAALGMAQTRVGGGRVTVMAAAPTGVWSRAIGLGIDEPVTGDVLDTAIAFARDHGAADLMFQIAPEADGDWERLLADRGATPGSTWLKLAGDTAERPDVPTSLRVERLGPEHAEEFARVLCVGFGMPLDSPLPGWFAGLPSQADRGFSTYGAWDGGDLVATASLFVHGGVGRLAGAVTLPSHRGRGAQSALMVHRVREAAARGCTWVTCETGPETPDGPNPSLRNMRRIGLTELYERRNWVWRP